MKTKEPLEKIRTYNQFKKFVGIDGVGLLLETIMVPNSYCVDLMKLAQEFGIRPTWLAFCAQKYILKNELSAEPLHESMDILKEINPLVKNKEHREELKRIVWRMMTRIAYSSRSVPNSMKMGLFENRKDLWKPFPGKLTFQEKIDLVNFMIPLSIRKYVEDPDSYGTCEAVAYTQTARIWYEEYVPWYKNAADGKPKCKD